jgi:hypothetical protein
MSDKSKIITFHIITTKNAFEINYISVAGFLKGETNITYCACMTSPQPSKERVRTLASKGFH